METEQNQSGVMDKLQGGSLLKYGLAFAIGVGAMYAYDAIKEHRFHQKYGDIYSVVVRDNKAMILTGEDELVPIKVRLCDRVFYLQENNGVAQSSSKGLEGKF